MYSKVFTLHSNLLKAMSHPKRLEVINLLRDQTLRVSQIQDMLDLTQANLSQHLMVMRKHGLVKTTKKGKEVYYQLSHKNILKASDLIREILVDQHQTDGLDGIIESSMKDLIPIVTDPVCHMRISPKTAGGVKKHQDKTYYFCASGCLQTFNQNPEKYI